MRIRRLLFETSIACVIITIMVMGVNSLQIRYNALKHFTKLQEQYLDATYEIYKDEIIGDILIGDHDTENALLKEISVKRGIEAKIIRDNNINVKKFIKIPLTKIYELDLGANNKARLSLHMLNDFHGLLNFQGLELSLLLEITVLGAGFIYLLWRFNKILLKPLAQLANNVNFENLDISNEAALEVKELDQILKVMSVETKKRAAAEAEANAAKQIVHDVHSPLASLNLLLNLTGSLPQETRTMMRTAVQRIADIINTLSNKSQEVIGINNKETVMLSLLVDSLVSEKRLQIRNKNKIHLEFSVEHSYGLFTKVNPVEMKRVLSNLINNSIEAFDDKQHKVSIDINKVEGSLKIIIFDDGKGIPKEILTKLGQRGITYGKNSNTVRGLGVSHAIETINSFGGSFSINSKPGEYTTVTISLPCVDTPSWFVKNLNLNQIRTVVILDDDHSIHILWKDKINRSKHKQIKILSFYCYSQFREYYLKKAKKV